MTVDITQEEMNILNSNGISEDDVRYNVEYMRATGMNDEEIRNSYTDLIGNFAPRQNTINMSGAFGDTYMTAAPKKTPIDNMFDCLRWVKQTGLSAWQEGANQAEIANLETEELNSRLQGKEFNPASRKRLEYLTNSAKQYSDYGIFKDKEYGNVIDNTPSNIKKSYVETMKMLPYMWETLKSGGVGAGIGLVVGGVAGAAIESPEGIGGIAHGAVQGSIWGARIGAGWKTCQLEGGLAKNELRQINKEIVEKGGQALPDWQIDLLSTGVGVVNGALELVGMKAALRTVPGGDKIIDYLEKGCVRKLATNETIKEYLAKQATKNFAKGVATEVSTEVLQECSNIIADEIAKSLGGIENTPLEQNVARVFDTGKATFGAMMFLGGIGYGAKIATIMKKQGNTSEQIKQALSEMTLAQQEEFVQQNMDTLFQSVEDLPTVQEMEKLDKLRNHYYEQNKNAGVEDSESYSTADIQAQAISNMAKDFGMDIDELNDRFNITTQTLTDEEAYEQYVNDNVATLQGRVEQNVYNDEFEHDDEYYLDMAEEYDDGVHYQSANTAGADANNIADAQREWQEKGTESKYFKNWFGDSKVVDSEGKPLVVYHGTNANFDTFDTNKSKKGKGFWFTSDKKYAKEHGNNLYSVYLKSKKLFDADKQEDEIFKYTNNPENLLNNKSTQNKLQKDGYDGIVFNKNDGRTYIVFNPEQIKSVDNRGTFDSNSGNIYYQSMIAGIDGKQEVDVVDLTSKFATDSTLTKKDLSAYIKTLIGNVNNLTDKDKKAIFDFVKKSKRIGKKDVYVPDHIAGSSKVENQYKDERNTFVNNILDLLENSTLIDVEKNTDKNKPNVDNYLRFYVPVKIGSDIYTVRVVAENNTGKNLFNILNADVYDVIVDKKMTASSPSTKGNLAKQSSDNIVPQNDENITSDTITIDDMLRGVLGPDKKPYFQSMTQEELLSTYLNQEFGMNTQEITDMVKSDVLRIMEESGVSEEEFNFEDVRIYGSYSKGTNKAGSDLDLVVQYSGNMKEDSAFNILHSEDLAIYDKNGNKVKIDINPINTAVHGMIDDYSRILFQSAYHGTPHRFDTFSTDNIGTGEGAQAHGWGLYFAENKEISDNYREKLTNYKKRNNIQSLDDEYDYLLIDGKPILENYKIDIDRTVYNYIHAPIVTPSWINTTKTFLQEKIDEWTKLSKDKEYPFKDYAIEKVDAYTRLLTDISNGATITEKADGQLFEVDIPDSDVLLDEDKELVQQPEKVQRAIEKIYADAMKSNNVELTNAIGITGKEIYRGFSKYFGSDKKASEFLNSYGIKGITYDGRQDGRCYVIFDDKAVNVLKTYYQGVNENKNNLKLTDEDKSNIQKFKDFVSKVFSNKLTKKEKSRQIELGKTPQILVDWGIPNNNITIGYKVIDKARNEKNDDHKLSQKTISNVLEALHNPIALIKDTVHDNEKTNNRYGIIIDLKNEKDNYVLVSIDTDKNIGSNYIINDIRSIHSRESFVPMLEKAVEENRLIKIKESKLKDLILGNQSDSFSEGGQSSLIDSIREKDKSVNGGILFQDNEQGNSTEEGIKNARGFTYQQDTGVSGSAIRNIIVLLDKKADKSTLLHEFAHVYLNVLTDLAKTNSKAKERLMTINKWLKNDGKSEYTTFQHEKFANGFVAYIKQGKAPTYGLKRAFEHFKKWLNDIYNTLNNSDDFILDSEAQAVFDEILGGTEHDNQLKQANELLNKAISYAEIKYAEKRDSEPIKQTQLSEYQRRYMNTAYDIIYYALQNHPEGKNIVKNRQQLVMIMGTSKNKTHYRKSRKGIVSQAEQIQEILANCGDVFSSNDGFLSEWGEFFNPISENYSDEELAMDAYECIAQERYLTRAFEDDVESQLYGEFNNKVIEETQNIFEYLVDEYKYAEDKTVPLLAWNEFHSRIHPYIVDDYEKKWESETAEIDRYQSLSQIGQAKEDLKLYAATMKGQGDFNSQFRDYAKKIIRRLDFLTDSDRLKIMNKINDFATFRDVEQNLDDIMDYAQTLQSVTERRMIADDIQREVKQTIHEWKNGIKKTKYTYPANKLFERLRELNRMTQEQVQDIYDEYTNNETEPDYTSDDVNSEDYYETIEKMFVRYKANGMYYNPTEFLKDLLDRIQSAKFTAKLSRDEIDFERRMNQLNLIDNCAQALNKRKTEISENDKIKFFADLNAFGFNFNGALKMIFNEDIKKWASLDYLYARKDGQVGKDRQNFLDKAKEVFGFIGKFADIQLQNKFIDMTKKEFTITQRHSPDIEKGNYRQTENNKESGKNYTVKTEQLRQKTDNLNVADEWKPIQVELSRMEVLYYYIQAKNETSYKILTDEEKGQFRQSDFDNLLEELTPQERLLGDLMQLSAEKYWGQLNAYHIKKYHVELGKVRNYFPRLTESQEVNMLEMFNDYSQVSSTGKFQKQRTAGAGTRIASANALAVLFDHMERANTVIIMGEHLDTINKVFKNPDLKRLLENTWGEKVSKEFYGQLTGNLFTGQSALKSLQEEWYGKLVNNLIKTNLFLKAQIGLKQILSFMNYGKGDEYVSAKEWADVFSKQVLTPSQWKKNIDFMMSNDYLKDRFSRGGSTDALKKQLDNRFFSKLSLLDEFWSLPIALGDIGAIILGGKPYIDVLMNKGYSKEEAFKIFIETTVNDQQSSIPSTLSNAQRNASKQPFSKMFFAYQNTPWQYYRQCTTAVMNAVQSGKKKDYLHAGKMVFLYGWFFPAIFAMASSLSPIRFAVTGDDDDLLKDINPLRTLTTLIHEMPIVADVLDGVLNAIDGKPFNSRTLLTKHVKSVNKLIRDIKKDGITLEDVWNSIVAASELSTGQPLGAAGEIISGVYDIAQGDFLKGGLKAFGYSDYRAKQAVGEENDT